MRNSAFWSHWVYLSAGRAGTGNNISLTSRLNGSIFTSQILADLPFLLRDENSSCRNTGWNRYVCLDIDRAYGAAAGKSWD